jgi:hypothetical protein
MSVGTKPCCAASFRALPSACFGGAFCCLTACATFDCAARFVVNSSFHFAATSALLPGILRAFADSSAATYAFTRLVRENERLLHNCHATFADTPCAVTAIVCAGRLFARFSLSASPSGAVFLQPSPAQIYKLPNR